jgi:hypothetical protein
MRLCIFWKNIVRPPDRAVVSFMTADGDSRFVQQFRELYEALASHFEDSSHE